MLKALFPILFSLLLINNRSLFSQAAPSLHTNEIDSLLSYRTGDTVLAVYNRFQKALRQSKEIQYKKGELTAYTNLMRFFGDRKNLDSLMFYALNFENSDYDGSDRRLIHNFFYTKGESLLIDFNQSEQALDELLKAYEYVDAESSTSAVSIKTLLAFIYMTKKQYQKTIELLEPFLKDTINFHPKQRLRTLTVLAQAHQNLFEPKKSFPKHLEALNIAQNLHDTANTYLIKSSMLHDYILQGHHQKAIDSGLRLIEPLKKYSPYNLPICVYNLAIAYDSIGRTDKAIHFMNQAISTADSDYNEIELLGILANFYGKENDFKNSVLSLKRKSDIVDNIRLKEQKGFIELYDTRIKVINQQREKEMVEAERKILVLKNKDQKQHITILSIGLIAVVLSISAGWVYLKYFKTKEKVKELKKNERAILKNHILVRETELSMLAANKAKWLSELSEIKEELSTAVRLGDRENIFTIEKGLDSFLRQLAFDDVFSKRLESQYPRMVISLKKLHPNLSASDIRHCLLAKLDLSLKESAQLTHVGIGAIKMGRNRAKAKMSLSKEDSLKQYLDHIEEQVVWEGN